MINTFEVMSKSKLAYKHRLREDSPEVISIDSKIKSNALNFASNKYYEYDKRLVTQFEPLSPENVVMLHLKYQIRKAFNVKFSNRNKVTDELFEKLRAVGSLKDATIVRFDLKNYFYSVETRFIFENYILNSRLDRADKDYLEDLCAVNRYCVAGLPIFNYFIELASRDLDIAIKTGLARYGLVLYSRYVDDGIVILNKYLPKKRVRKVINMAIDDVFNCGNNLNKVSINENKFSVINRRHLTSNISFDFLGYEFFIKNNFSEIKIGITARKRSKYQQKINKLIKDNYTPGDASSEELTRHIIKAHCSRVVYFAPSAKHRGVWVSKGIIASYNRLKDYEAHIDIATANFLKQIYVEAFTVNGHGLPQYLSNRRYNLHDSLIANKAMIFDELIGMSKDSLLGQLSKLGVAYGPDQDYHYLTKDYLIRIKSGY